MQVLETSGEAEGPVGAGVVELGASISPRSRAGTISEAGKPVHRAPMPEQVDGMPTVRNFSPLKSSGLVPGSCTSLAAASASGPYGKETTLAADGGCRSSGAAPCLRRTCARRAACWRHAEGRLDPQSAERLLACRSGNEHSVPAVERAFDTARETERGYHRAGRQHLILSCRRSWSLTFLA